MKCYCCEKKANIVRLVGTKKFNLCINCYKLVNKYINVLTKEK